MWTSPSKMARSLIIAALAAVCLLSVVASTTAAGASAAGRDYCALGTLPGYGFWAGPTTPLSNCFKSLPFDKDSARKTAYILSQVASLYSFSDIVTNSSAPWFLTVDLRNEVKQLQVQVEQNAFPNDYAFHTAAAAIFNQLYDAHTQYRLPTGFLNGTLIRPFSLKASLVSGEMRFFLAQGPLGDLGDELFRTLFGFDPAPYVGQQVLNLNGLDTLTALQKEADRYFTQYKDAQVRFNAMMRQKGWGFIPLQRYAVHDLPKADIIVLPNQQVKTINIVMYPGGMSSTAQLIEMNACKKYCMKTPFNPNNITVPATAASVKPVVSQEKLWKRRWINPHDEERDIFNHLERLVQKSPVGLKVAQNKLAAAAAANANAAAATPASIQMNQLRVIANDDFNDTQFAVMFDPSQGKQIPVLRVQTFLPRDLNGSIATILAFVDWCAMNSAESGIIDVSHNGGGIICLSDMLLATLIEAWAGLNPKANPTPAYGVYDLRQSPITDLIVKNSFYQPQFLNGSIYLNISTRQTYAENDVSWYTSGSDFTRGGRTSKYSIKNFFPNECEDYAVEIAGRADYFLKNLVIITDGTCGSACALFTGQLIAHRASFKGQNVKIMSHGGVYSKNVDFKANPMDTASFAGGNVLDTMALAEMFNQTGYADQRLPLQFSSSAIARFNFHEYYTTEDAQVPREFLRLPADFHVYNWDCIFNSDITTYEGNVGCYNLYKQATQLFSKSKKGSNL